MGRTAAAILLCGRAPGSRAASTSTAGRVERLATDLAQWLVASATSALAVALQRRSSGRWQHSQVVQRSRARARAPVAACCDYCWLLAACKALASHSFSASSLLWTAASFWDALYFVIDRRDRCAAQRSWSCSVTIDATNAEDPRRARRRSARGHATGRSSRAAHRAVAAAAQLRGGSGGATPAAQDDGDATTDDSDATTRKTKVDGYVNLA